MGFSNVYPKYCNYRYGSCVWRGGPRRWPPLAGTHQAGPRVRTPRRRRAQQSWEAIAPVLEEGHLGADVPADYYNMVKTPFLVEFKSLLKALNK